MDPMRRLRGVAWVVRETIDGFVRDDCQDRAAGLAFYTLFSLGPLLVIVLKLTALAVDPTQVARYVEEQAGSLVGLAGAEQIRAILEAAGRDAPGSLEASIVSALLALGGAMTVLVQLQRSLNHVWRVQPAPGLNLGPFLLKRAISLAMMAIIAFLLVVSLVASAILAAASGWLATILPQWLGSPASAAIDVGVSVVVFAAVFSAMFKFLPDAEITFRQVSVGGLFTSVLFVAGKSLIGLYIGSSPIASFYGAAGSLAVVLVWVYYNAILVLFGAELTRAYAAWLGQRRVRPAAFATAEEPAAARDLGPGVPPPEAAP
jgi:membrane protein